MSEHLITIEGGATKRLPTAGKLCEKDILITAIGGGNGLPEGISELVTGTITPTSNITANYTITHGLGKIPDFAILMLLDDAATTALKTTLIFQLQGHKLFNSSGTVIQTRGLIVYQNANGQATNSIITATTEETPFVTDTTVTFKLLSAYPLKAGYTYQWVCGVLKDVL